MRQVYPINFFMGGVVSVKDDKKNEKQTNYYYKVPIFGFVLTINPAYYLLQNFFSKKKRKLNLHYNFSKFMAYLYHDNR